MRTILLLLLILLFSVKAYAASFNCSKAQTLMEKAICEDPSLSKLDEELSVQYNKLNKALKKDDQFILLAEQKKWIKYVGIKFNSEKDNDLLKLDYEYRIKGINNLMNKTLPSLKEIQSICKIFLEKGMKIDWITEKNYDINNDGTNEILKQYWTGTMNIPSDEYQTLDGKDINIESIDYEWGDYWTYGVKRFKYNEKIYSYHTFDDDYKKPAYISYMTPENKRYVVCEFENKEKDSFHPINGYLYSKEICNIVKTQNLSRIQLSKKSIITSTELDEMGRWETNMERQGWVDYDNDGQNNYIGELEYSSSAGRGCEFVYYDELNKIGNKFIDNPSRRLLLKMQSVDIDNRHPNCGGMKSKLFKFKNKIYYDYNTPTERRISIIENGKINIVCIIKKNITTFIKSIGIPRMDKPNSI